MMRCAIISLLVLLGCSQKDPFAPKTKISCLNLCNINPHRPECRMQVKSIIMSGDIGRRSAGNMITYSYRPMNLFSYNVNEMKDC